MEACQFKLHLYWSKKGWVLKGFPFLGGGQQGHHFLSFPLFKCWFPSALEGDYEFVLHEAWPQGKRVPSTSNAQAGAQWVALGQ